ncbi:ABC transporter permease [Haloechinothrix sp. LS1_15]|uniref:ABC transporter permease n=1 Tax=Haloechinothrix sp. LS1_15 TaxID=2652248 RepID=UPI002944410E|nr:ABC transporter permease [Haloechinothrix sp. LS1_15]MDV6011492.1 ABC transporter permease [Haloechinothrix sp. LS1_15]
MNGNVKASAAPAETRPGVTPAHRLAALARAEFTLLRRNKLLMVNAFVIPLLPIALLIPARSGGRVPQEAAVIALALLVLVLLLFVVYYNLLSSYVARREELVLKRLRTGECSDAEILLGTALPAVTVALGMVLLMSLVGTLALGLPAPENPIVLLLAVLGGAAVFTSLALITTTFTKNSEAAQITSLPVIGISVLGLPWVADALPQSVGEVVPYLPLAPVAELTMLGWLGLTPGGDRVAFAEIFQLAWQPALVMLAWLVLGAMVAHRYFRWEPRR